MISRISKSLKNIDLRLYAALLFLGLCPALYTTLRSYLVGQLPGDYAYSIAGQLSWVSLIYEVVSEAIILPLFYFLGRADGEEFSSRLRSGLAVTAAVYSVIAVLVCAFTGPLLRFMAVSHEIIPESAVYIRLESVAYIFRVLFDFASVALITAGGQSDIYALIAAKCLLSAAFDVLLVSELPVSLRLGVNGIAVSNALSSLILLAVVLRRLERSGYRVFGRQRLSFGWMREFAGVGGISGLESFVRNLAYMLMISRMVNMVSAQGVYWVANNFIWGWLLLPVIQLGELIKKEVAADRENIKKNTAGYLAITAAVCVLWVAAIPLYKPFMSGFLGYSDVDGLYHLVMLLLPFYALYAFQNVFDASFYGAGRTEYMLFESIVTNSLYYGACFIAYRAGLWTPSLDGIALMFGFGNLFDSVVSALAYRAFLRREFR
ncbi:MAG: multidrug transporter [Firmicutes bacterium]|nr:multidrug transporter [Bacillota bacterium]